LSLYTVDAMKDAVNNAIARKSLGDSAVGSMFVFVDADNDLNVKEYMRFLSLHHRVGLGPFRYRCKFLINALDRNIFGADV